MKAGQGPFEFVVVIALTAVLVAVIELGGAAKPAKAEAEIAIPIARIQEIASGRTGWFSWTIVRDADKPTNVYHEDYLVVMKGDSIAISKLEGARK